MVINHFGSSYPLSHNSGGGTILYPSRNLLISPAGLASNWSWPLSNNGTHGNNSDKKILTMVAIWQRVSDKTMKPELCWPFREIKKLKPHDAIHHELMRGCMQSDPLKHGFNFLISRNGHHNPGIIVLSLMHCHIATLVSIHLSLLLPNLAENRSYNNWWMHMRLCVLCFSPHN